MLKHQILQSLARALLVVLVFLPAACGGSTPSAAGPTAGPLVRDTPAPAPTQSAPPTSPTDTPAPATAPPAPTAANSAGPANLLISYNKSGGIAGVDETLTVYADGSIVLQDRAGEARAQAAASDIHALQTLLASPEFAALSPTRLPAAADQFVYELTVPGRAQPIVAADGADNPPVLDQLIGELEKLKARVK
ncbi:MAG TPA: hypothetical protein VFU22_20285 [Roseiflexaceae bacterium]|nr:hypothetical protein [Roseiflexaceae bacterium]